MVRDTDAIAADLTVGTASPDPETTLEALIRAYNAEPRFSDLSPGSLLQVNAAGDALVEVDVSSFAEDDELVLLFTSGDR